MHCAFRHLCYLLQNAYESNVLQAACWLLCSLSRVSPNLLNAVFDHLQLTNKQAHQFSPKILHYLGSICQSQAAVNFLISKNLIDQWAELARDICANAAHHKTQMLYGIVECFNQLASIDTIVEYFDSSEGGSLFRQLIEYMCKYCSVSARQAEHAASGAGQKLVDAGISLIRKCLAYGGGHRERVALITADFINQAYTYDQKGVPLPETLEALVIRLVITDESIPLRLSGVVAKTQDPKQTLESRVMHPLFGCNQDDRIIDVSLYTKCEKLLPCRKTVPVVGTATKPSSKENNVSCFRTQSND